jgi:hypothetical protein
VWPSGIHGQAVALEDGSVRLAEHGVAEAEGDRCYEQRGEQEEDHFVPIMRSAAAARG